MADIVNMPKLGFDMAEGVLVRWVIAEGEAVKRGAVLAEIETDKATVEVESTFEGVVRRHLVEEGASIPVGRPIAVIGQPDENIDSLISEAPPGEKPAEKKAVVLPSVQSGTAEQPAAPASGRVRSSPLARRVANMAGVNLAELKGSGPGGRIVRKDVEAYLSAKKTPAGLPEPGQVTVQTAAPQDVVVDVNRLRAAIGRRMTESKQQIPHFYITHLYKMDSLMTIRSQSNEFLPEEDKLSVNDFIIKAAALALRRYPNLNASLNGNQIIHRGQVNIGVAVSVEGGLLTVVCKDADQKTLRQISAETRAMVGRARQGKVRPDDIEGSTFSISNLGMYDVESFVAIINPPETAILAVGSARQVPVVENGALAIGWRMNATLSADHRITDGAEAAQFMQALAGYLEKPLQLML
jgi:pyruvate dehydrogenase E2 component (dihydrolipoamide acetyltransferase)